mmetsp:Transcript_11875/g.27843  ORF Transcript_11875/g.27843 Transcript_11875/m.27843 type:complete len:142 (+) Transcript_11875:77-502(+)
MAVAKSPEAKIIEDEMSMYRQLEAQQNHILSTRQSSLAQLRENEMVKDEMERLEEDAPVFKLVGPVLMRQDPDEAKQNVEKRIEFIRGEIKKSEAKIEENKKRMQEHGEKIMKLQGEMRSKAAEAAQAVYKQQTELEEPDE